ncbi:uncharacterized protein LOC125554185 [Triticum urartu]|uniref:uncharacterized protein LOC125554185 n=1 Tax=Triticum urartu TaxID=4572 RepID=UPI0020438297|nr:uncharacterized protein LOC125554185 [Triticum urartu]
MAKGGGCLSKSQRLSPPLGPHRREFHPCPRRTGAAPGPHLRRLLHHVGPRRRLARRAVRDGLHPRCPRDRVPRRGDPAHPVLARMALTDAGEMNMGEPPRWTTTASSSPPSSRPSSAAPLPPSLPRASIQGILPNYFSSEWSFA